jgi:hypothetical protein
LHPAAVIIRRVAGEGAVYHRRAGVIVEHPAANAKKRRIAGEGAVYHRRAGVIVLHPTAITRRVA